MTDLLINLPLWLVGLLIIGGAMLLAVGCMLALRPLIRRSVQEGHNDVAGYVFAVVGTLYAVLLAFLVFAVWNQYQTAQDTASNESASIGALYRNVQIFPQPVRGGLSGEIRSFVRSVIADEWPALAHGHSSLTTRHDLNRIYLTFRQIQPRTNQETQTYAAALRALDDASQQRVLLIQESASSLQTILWFVLILAAIITICFSFLFFMENIWVQGFITISLTGVIAAVLFLLVVLDHPFAGAERISPADFVTLLQTIRDISRT
jgi:hypothetical protein